MVKRHRSKARRHRPPGRQKIINAKRRNDKARLTKAKRKSSRLRVDARPPASRPSKNPGCTCLSAGLPVTFRRTVGICLLLLIVSALSGISRRSGTAPERPGGGPSAPRRPVMEANPLSASLPGRSPHEPAVPCERLKERQSLGSERRKRRRRKDSDCDLTKPQRQRLRPRIPIQIPVGRNLRVLTVGRYSRDEQRQQSIRAQHHYNRSQLSGAGIDMAQVDIEEISDEGISGELRDRPGIGKIREGIRKRKWDIIVAEDSSRIYRNKPACLDLVGLAVDHKIRVFCVNDNVDTAEEDWYTKLDHAQDHHCGTNFYLRERLSRTFQELWEDGAAVGPLHPGYRRTPNVPATDREPAEGPWYDEIDERWAPTILEVYERVARRERRWLIAEWLTEIGLPKINGEQDSYTVKTLIALVQHDGYRGTEVRGKTRSIKQYSTGKSIQERSQADQRQERKMEHLRIVPDALWFAANQVIAEDNTRDVYPIGEANPLHSIPRDSRQPLSRVFLCKICGGKMYGEGRNEGGYKCSNSHNWRRTKRPCWNKATCLRDITHAQISKAIVAQITALNGVADGLSAHLASLFIDEDRWRAMEQRLQADIKTSQTAIRGLVKAMEAAEEDELKIPQSLVRQLTAREDELLQRETALEEFRHERRDRPPIPSATVIRAAIEARAKDLLTLDRSTSSLVEQLLSGPILAVPYQQFRGKLVVLRAEFTLNLVGVLPDEVVAWLAGKEEWKAAEWLPPVHVQVDLFEPSTAPANAIWANELRSFLTLEEIGNVLGISKRSAHLAAELGKAMLAAGLTDPYVRLSECPTAPSRWRFRSDNDKRKQRAG